MPFDNSQFEVGFAPAITPSPLSAPLRPGIEGDELLSILEEARKKIENPENWSHVGAGNSCDKFCTVMAVNAVVMGRARGRLFHDALGVLKSALGAEFLRDVIDFNEHPTTTHADVLSLFDRAIEARHAALVAEGAPIK